MNVLKKLPLFFLAYSFLLNHETAFASFYSDIHGFIIGGGGFTRINGKNIWLAYTPEPGLENNFKNDVWQRDTYLIGAGFEKHFSKKLINLDSFLGVEIDYLRNNSLSGIVHPMVNVAPDFDILNYSYHLNSLSFYVTGKLSKQILLPNFGIYLQGGIGGAINRLNNYAETSPANSSAAPMLEPFRDGRNSNFAYFIGAGVSSQIGVAQVSVGYRYIFSGSAEFKPSLIQQTNNPLNFSPISHQFLVVSFMI